MKRARKYYPDHLQHEGSALFSFEVIQHAINIYIVVIVSSCLCHKFHSHEALCVGVYTNQAFVNAMSDAEERVLTECQQLGAH